MKTVALLLLPLLCSSILTAQPSATWLRYPALSPDGRTIVFCWHGDLYTVPAAGGTAKPLVVQAAHELMPVWSHDGRQIAFASNRYGNYDIFIVSARGGVPERLTWHSADEYPYDFSANGRLVIFGAVRMDAPANRQFPSDALQELYTVPAAGGRSRQILTTPAEDAKQSVDGRFIVYHDRKARENPWRKHQVSSAARDIWMYDAKSGTHWQLTQFAGEDRTPVFANNGQDLYYLSERSGSFNVYQLSLSDTSSSRQLTFFKGHPVRFLSSARDNTLCFGYDGQIWIKKKNSAARKVNITMPAVKEQSIKTIPITEAQELSIAPSGQEFAFIFRGEVFVSSIDGNHIKRITHTPGEEAGLSFSPDGRKLLYAGERDSSWKIFQAAIVRNDEPFFNSATQVNETAIIANEQENDQAVWSPNGNEIAFIENRNVLKVYNCGSRSTRMLLSNTQLFSKRDHDQYFEWSPDSQWLLVQFVEQGGSNEEVGLIHASGQGGLVNLTRSGFSETRPRWMMDGKMIIFSSDRQGLHSYDNSGITQTDIYGLFTHENDWRNFNRQKTSRDTLPGTDSLKKAAAQHDPVPTLTDWNSIHDRKERLTTNASLLGDALVSRDGRKIYYLAKLEKNYDLWQTDLRTKETKRLLRLNLRNGTLQWDKKQRAIFLVTNEALIRIDTGMASQQYIHVKGEMTIDLKKERAAMFEHVWRRTAQTFYAGGMHGAAWATLKKSYQHYLDGIDNNEDFAEMLNELLGELNVSHTAANYNSERRDIDITGSLGVFYDQQFDGAGVRIEALIPGGPLDHQELAIKPGDIIVAIDGQYLNENKDIAYYLNGKAGKQLTITISNGKRGRDCIITAISPAEESDLLYKRWVQRNREETERKTNGEWGYVHLYRMNDAAYRNVYEDVLGKYAHCKGIIVDTRFNRGGDLAPELITFLSGIKMRENANDHFVIGNEPSFRWTKPSIVLAGESNYSDGHCFVYDYQYLHMGKLIGMPIPGSCTWMAGQSLQDPSLSYSVPVLGVKTNDGVYLENYQTEPDIRVMNQYEFVSKGQDQQLEEAIRQTKHAKP